MRIQNLRFNAVLRQHRARCKSNVRLVVIGKARRIDNPLAPIGGSVRIDCGRIVRAQFFEALRLVFWERGVLVEASDLFKHSPHEFVASAGDPIGEWRQETRSLAVAISLGEFTVRNFCLALAGLDRAMAQH